MTQTAPRVESTLLYQLWNRVKECATIILFCLQLENLYFVFIKKCVHYLKFCVYTWIHIVFFFLWEYCYHVFIHAIDRADIWLFLVLHVRK